MEIDCRYEGRADRVLPGKRGGGPHLLQPGRQRLPPRRRRTAGDGGLPDPRSRPGDCLRFVLSNRVGETDVARLRATIQARAGRTVLTAARDESLLHALFAPEVSSTGSGFGLTVVADFVAGAFGLRDRAEALRERYAGAILDGKTFRVWFHWPMAHDHLPQKLDDYHRPGQSLSEP